MVFGVHKLSWLATLILVSSCSSAGGFGQLASDVTGSNKPSGQVTHNVGSSEAGSVSDAGPSDDQSTSSASSSAPSTQDSEAMVSTAPIQVAGAFLTTMCGPADADLDGLPEIGGQDAYGCLVTADHKTKYSGLVNLKTVAVNSVGLSQVVALLYPAAPTSRWNSYFYLDPARRGLSINYDVVGVVDGVRVVMDMRPPPPTGCVTKTVKSTNVNSWGAAVWKSGPVKVFEGLPIGVSDVLSWVGSKGLQVAPSDKDLNTCPYLWDVSFKDAAGKQVGASQRLAAFGAGQQVPTGAATIWFASRVTAPTFLGAFGCDLTLAMVKTECH